MFSFALLLTMVWQDPQDENILGWSVEPPAAVEGQETELDRLSQSSSGASFLPQVFGGESDDMRIPVEVTLRALDKITARFTDLTVPIGEPQSFGSLTLLPRTCSTRPPEEFPETSVFLEVYASENDVAGQRARDEEMDEPGSVSLETSIDEEIFGQAVFRGWMFASSPSLNAMEHPTYDVWVIDCKMEDPDI
jgi:hypothetical protein